MSENAQAIAGKEQVGPGLRVLAFVYQRMIRPWLPGRPLLYAGIPVCYDRKWGDALVPSAWLPDTGYETGLTDEPGYEVALIDALKESVRPGDHVVVVGGGVGITAVIAALRTGTFGAVTCFEGSLQYARHIEETARRNNISNLTVHHAIVSKPIAVYGHENDFGTVIPPNRLPDCDVLELDCEGAEVDILQNMTIRPRVIIVETHGAHGAPTSFVDALLRERGYTVRGLGLAEPRLENICRENDIQVLLATRTT